MKRIFLLLVCLLLAAGCLLSLTACGDKPDTEETLDPDTFHFPYEDLPDVEKSDSAYLLDPDFAITEENVSTCIHDYFSAPSILYYNILPFSYDETPFMKDAKAVNFAKVFRDVAWKQIPKEEFHGYNVTSDFYFCNAIGIFGVSKAEGATYISFSNNYNSGNESMYFRANRVDLLPELIETAISLKDVSIRTDPELENYLEYVNSYNMYDDLPDISESDAAYLLDPDFAITEANFFDCVYDYFTAPASLQFWDLRSLTLEIDNPEKAAAFAETFRDFSPPTVSPASSSDLSEITRPDDDDYQGSYWFTNAIGYLRFDSWKDLTCVEFSRSNSFVHDTVKFRLQGNLFVELVAIGDSLKNEATEPTHAIWKREQITTHDHSGYHEPEEDFSNVQESDAAYLLDPEFTVTAENFSDCMDDYFSAPSILFYHFIPLYGFENQFIQDERAANFADAFHDLTLTPLSEEEQDAYYAADFQFRNAIGSLDLVEEDGSFYIYFCRQNDSVHDKTAFQVDETDLIKELNRTAVSLKDIAKAPVYENEGE